MNLTRALLAILCASVFYVARGQELPATFKNTVYINPLSPFVRTLNVSYERFLNQRFSMRIGGITGAIYPGGSSGSALRSFKYTGGTFEFRRYIRTYPGKTAEDFFFGPYLQAFKDQIKDFKYRKSEGYSRDVSGKPLKISIDPLVFKAGFMAGVRQIYFKRLAAEASAGIHYQHASEEVETSTEIINLMAADGISFRLGIHLGICF